MSGVCSRHYSRRPLPRPLRNLSSSALIHRLRIRESLKQIRRDDRACIRTIRWLAHMKSFVSAAFAFCFLAGMVGAAQTPEPFLLKPLDHGAWAAIDNPAAKSQQSGSNAGFVIGTDSVLVLLPAAAAPQ